MGNMQRPEHVQYPHLFLILFLSLMKYNEQHKNLKK